MSAPIKSRQWNSASGLKKLVEDYNNRHLDDFTAQVYNEVFEQAENFKKYVDQ